MMVNTPLRAITAYTTRVRAAASIFSSTLMPARLPSSTPATPMRMGRIEAAESALRALGYDDLRVRLCEGGVRLELPESELERAVRGRGEILGALDGMGRVTLDLRGR